MSDKLQFVAGNDKLKSLLDIKLTHYPEGLRLSVLACLILGGYASRSEALRSFLGSVSRKGETFPRKLYSLRKPVSRASGAIVRETDDRQ